MDREQAAFVGGVSYPRKKCDQVGNANDNKKWTKAETRVGQPTAFETSLPSPEPINTTDSRPSKSRRVIPSEPCKIVT